MALYAFDGTWNTDEIDDTADTNVCRFRDAYAEPDVANLYTKGVGTKWGFFGKVVGGVTGAGGWARVIQARKHLEEHWRGEPIVIVGFSRGSALALDFANEIAKGVTPKRVPLAPGEKTKVPSVRFLGLWDLVASFGIPGNKINLGYQLTVPSNVVRCCHAMALDERRYTFALTRVKYAQDASRAQGEKRAEEVWFRGGHSDIGGGNRNVARSNIALRWMMLSALASGVPLNAAAMPPALGPDDEPPIRAKRWLVKWKRKPEQNERVHYTVRRSLGKGFVDPPTPFQEEFEVEV